MHQKLKLKKKDLINKKFILYGAGQLSEMAIDIWPKIIKKPCLILDKHKNGILKKIKIENPENWKGNKENTLLVLSALKITPSEVKRLFKKHKQKIISVYDIFEIFKKKEFSNGWWGDFSTIKENTYKKNLSYFKDKNSKQIYQAVFKWRYKRILSNNYKISNEEKKYQNFFLSKKKYKYNIIDAGQYDLQFFNFLKKEKFIYQFIGIEPSDYRANIILKKIKKEKNVKFYNYGLGDKNEKKVFINDKQLCAKFTSLNKGKKKIIKNLRFYMDKFESNRKTILKLHIEGDEFKVINSSKNILKNNKFSLLINLSHNEKSFLDIPKILNKLNYKKMKLYNTALMGEGLYLFAEN